MRLQLRGVRGESTNDDGDEVYDTAGTREGRQHDQEEKGMHEGTLGE